LGLNDLAQNFDSNPVPGAGVTDFFTPDNPSIAYILHILKVISFLDNHTDPDIRSGPDGPIHLDIEDSIALVAYFNRNYGVRIPVLF
jgi:hypothetical protein